MELNQGGHLRLWEELLNKGIAQSKTYYVNTYVYIPKCSYEILYYCINSWDLNISLLLSF